MLFIRRCLSTSSNFSVSEQALEFLKKRKEFNGFDALYLKKLTILNAPQDQGSCLAELRLDGKELVNINSVLHGGVIASLVDTVTTIALYNSPTRKTGVSVNMNIK